MATELTSRALINQKSLRELAVLLVRDGNIHEGLFDISLEIQVAIGTLGPTPDESYPGALMGVKSIGLLPAEKANPHTVDAALVNPRARARMAPDVVKGELPARTGSAKRAARK